MLILNRSKTEIIEQKLTQIKKDSSTGCKLEAD